MQAGGMLDDKNVINRDLVSFETGNDLVFFLYSRSNIGRPAVLLNPTQSVYEFPDVVARGRSHDIVLNSLYSNNHLRLTLSDLIELSKNQ